VTYTYDCAENRDAMMDADNGLFTYTHDAKNRLTNVINPKNEITTIAYDRADRETRRDLADTTFTTRDYDNAGRIDVLSNERFAGSVISRFTYTYDCADNRTDVAELDGTRVTWTYDRKYQLLSEFRDDTSPASSYRNTYTYDPTGNRLQKVAADSTTTYVYDACNELNHEATWQHADPAGTRVNIVYTYDECGNRIERDPDNLGATTYYTYDAQNRVIEVNPGAAVELAYNADDQRIEKEATAGTTKYIFDFKKLLQETDGMDDTTALYTGTLKDEFGDLVSQFREDASGFYQYDATGSASELTDASAAVKNLYVFEAFGTPAHEVTDTNFPNSLNWIGSQGYYNDLEFDYYILVGSQHRRFPGDVGWEWAVDRENNHRCHPRQTFICKRTTLLLGCNEIRRFIRGAPINTARDAGETLHVRRPTRPFPQRPKSTLQKTKHAVRNHLKLVPSPHTFSNTNFEKKTPSRTQLGVHLGAF